MAEIRRFCYLYGNFIALWRVRVVPFWQDRRGGVGIIFALSAMVLIVVAGAAIDFGRATYARNDLQSAVDSAALAAGREVISPTDTSEQITAQQKAVAERWFQLNLRLPLGTVGPLQLAYTPGTGLNPGSTQVSVSATVPTVFLQLIGVKEFKLNVSAVTQRATTGPLDLVLVLDTTNSMAVSNKFSTLKTAAVDMVNEVMQYNTAAAPEIVRVGYVPFATYINVGPQPDTTDWLIGATSVQTPTNCGYPQRSGCSMQVRNVCDGQPCLVEVCTNMGPRICTSSETRAWQGCVGTREASLRPSIAFNKNINSNLYNRVIITSTSANIPQCSSSMQPLTINKSLLTSGINALVTSGETYIPAGLLWGWNILTPEQPMTGGRTKQEMQQAGGTKAMVLMTDGENSLSPVNAWRGGYARHMDTIYVTADYTNTLTKDLCTNIKMDGIRLFTVAFMVTDPGIKSILEQCASDGQSYFDAENNADLVAAFRDISSKLRRLKLSN
jgi:Flp pilus assembly protein TadG